MATLKEITQSKRFPLMATLTTIATVGGVIIALNAFTGLNLRPAWGFEVDTLTASATEAQRMLKLATNERAIAARAIVDLRKGQLNLKVEQIQYDQRELRRELTRQRVQADEYRQKTQPVPVWLLRGISDTESRILELDTVKSRAQDRLLDLTK